MKTSGSISIEGSEWGQAVLLVFAVQDEDYKKRLVEKCMV